MTTRSPIEAVSEVVLQLAKDKPNSPAFRAAVTTLVELSKDGAENCVRATKPKEAIGDPDDEEEDSVD